MEGLHNYNWGHTNFQNLRDIYRNFRRLITNDFAGEKLLVSGWGVSDIQKPATNSVLKAAYVTGISLIDCEKSVGQVKPSHQD